MRTWSLLSWQLFFSFMFLYEFLSMFSVYTFSIFVDSCDEYKQHVEYSFAHITVTF